MRQSQQQQQEQRQGVQDWLHGPGAYNLGLEMGQHVDIIAISATPISSRVSGSDSYALLFLFIKKSRLQAFFIIFFNFCYV